MQLMLWTKIIRKNWAEAREIIACQVWLTFLGALNNPELFFSAKSKKLTNCRFILEDRWTQFSIILNEVDRY